MRVVAVDIGGTHARFALAEVGDGRVAWLGEAVTLRTADHPSFESAWRAFAATCGAPLPRAAAIAVAAQPTGEEIRFTNNPWTIRPVQFAEQLGLDQTMLLNDFAAVAHAVAHVGEGALEHVCGPDRPLAATGLISVIGPGTGLGVALLQRLGDGYQVHSTEGGHSDFAPLDPVEDAILARLRQRFARVSVERIVAGPGLAAIYEGLAASEGRAIDPLDERLLWDRALGGTDRQASAALDRFCRSLGSVAGDIALTQGAFGGVVIAGGLGLRLRTVLRQSGFAERFCAKGRFAELMATIPVKLITHPQPGLFGAAAAYAQEHCR